MMMKIENVSNIKLKEQVEAYKKSCESEIERCYKIQYEINKSYQQSLSYIKKIDVVHLLEKAESFIEVFNREFPNTKTSIDMSDESCINIYIYDITIFLSYEFCVLLDNFSKELSDEEYMLINFIPKENT